MRKNKNSFRQNSQELFLEKLLNQLYPKTYKFVGDGQIFIAGFVPDFIHIKRKKIIEFFGTYWHQHTKEKDKLRLKTYKKYGYATLVIWDTEFDDLAQLKNKIRHFTKK